MLLNYFIETVTTPNGRFCPINRITSTGCPLDEKSKKLMLEAGIWKLGAWIYLQQLDIYLFIT
jgi:hypothetical protein